MGVKWNPHFEAALWQAKRAAAKRAAAKSPPPRGRTVATLRSLASNVARRRAPR